MARYNDTENTIKAIKKRFNVYHEIPCSQDDRRVQEIIGIVIRTIETQSTADVVPKSEVDKTIAEWAYLHADVLNKLENAKAEVAMEIFEEIEELLKRTCERGYCGSINDLLAELKKKYTEENKND